MNKTINCLTQSQVELLRCHIDYLIEHNLVKLEDDTSDFVGYQTYQMAYDPPFENILHHLKPKVEEAYGQELVPTYSFWRRYFKGQDCPPHRDRPSCEVSLTLNLGGEGGNNWAFYVEEEKFELDIGQATIYKGCEQEHWRHELPYKHHSQLFLHYIEKNGQYYPKYQYDERPNLYFSIMQ